MSCCCSRTASSCSAPSDGGWRWHRGCCISQHPLCEVVPGAVQAWPAAVRGGAIIIMAVPCHGCCARYSTHCTVHSTLTMGSALMPACMLTMSSSSVSLYVSRVSRVLCRHVSRVTAVSACAARTLLLDNYNILISTLRTRLLAARLGAAAGGASCGPHTGDRDPARPSPASRRSEPGWAVQGRAVRAVRRRGGWPDIKFISRARAAAGQ